MKDNSSLKLHLGCGTNKLEGWVNVDSVADCQPDLVHDVSQPLPYQNESVDEILAEDLLEHFGRKPEEPEIAGVILSHAHADHANYVSFLHKKIPIYCGETCLSILEAVEEQSQRSIECEISDYKQSNNYIM